MASFSDLPLEGQYAHAVVLFNKTANSWPALDQLTSLSNISGVPTIVDAPVSIEVQPTDHHNRGAAAHAALISVKHHARELGVISSNEDLDEIATSHLKYLLLPFLCAAALEDVHGERHERIVSLQNAQHNLTEFFQTLDGLSLLSVSDRSRVLENDDDEMNEMQSNNRARMPRSETREEKIARFKAEKEAERKLNVLMQRARDVQQRGANAAAEVDEEVERQVNMVILQSAVRRAIDLHSSIQREQQVLNWAHQQAQRGRDPAEEARKRRGQHPPQPIVPGMPHTFRIVNERKREQEAMFRPGHNLPTYSVEQWGEIQAREMQKKQAREGDIRAKQNAEGNDDDDDAPDSIADAKTMEARRWDDWKDDHNQGSGNTIR